MSSQDSQQHPLRRTAAENLLYSENEKSDYEWLVTPPGSPNRSATNQFDAPDANPMTLKSRLENYSKEKRGNISSENQTTSLHDSSSFSRTRRPSSSTSSSRSTSRPSTPTRRSTTPAKRASTPASRATLTSSSTSSSRSTSRPSSSSGTSRVTLPAARETRPTTSTGQRTTGSATSTRSNNRPMSAPNSNPGSRSSTPTRRPSTPNGSSTLLRSKPTKPGNKPILSQGASPVVRSRPWEPYEMPGFSLEAPSNLRTTLPSRPQTASSSRTRAFGASSSSRSASIERKVARRQSCSPSRSRAPIGNVNGAVPLLRGRRAKTNINDDGGLISHVAKGNQKIERVVNMRKLAPVPRLTESCARGRGGGGGSSAGKSSSGSNGSDFGRNTSKSSIDMALRHMDIRRGSMAGNFRQSVTKVPATSLYSGRSGRNRPVSSSGSLESSVNVLCLDSSDDNLSDRSYS